MIDCVALPDDALLHILQYLTTIDIMRHVSRVNKQWRLVTGQMVHFRVQRGSLFVVGPYVLQNYPSLTYDNDSHLDGACLRLLSTNHYSCSCHARCHDRCRGGDHSSDSIVGKSLFSRLSEWSSYSSLSQYYSSVIVSDHLCYYYLTNVVTMNGGSSSSSNMGGETVKGSNFKLLEKCTSMHRSMVCRSLETDEVLWRANLLPLSHFSMDKGCNDDEKEPTRKKRTKTKTKSKSRRGDERSSTGGTTGRNITTSHSSEQYVNRIVHDHDVLCVFGNRIEPRVLYVIYKGSFLCSNESSDGGDSSLSNGECGDSEQNAGYDNDRTDTMRHCPGFVKLFKSSSDISSVVLTPNYIVVGTERGVEVVAKNQSSNRDNYSSGDNSNNHHGTHILKSHAKINLLSTHYSHSIHFSSIYFDYVTRNERDVFYVDKRMNTLGTVVLECYSCETAELIYRYDMYDTGLTGFIESTLASSDVWCVIGATFDKCRQIHLIDLETGSAVVLNNTDFKSCHLVVQVSSAHNSLPCSPELCVGLCSLDRKRGKCSYYRLRSQNSDDSCPREPQWLWTIDIPELPTFRYHPNVQIMLVRDALFMLLFEGSTCILSCITADTGTVLWHHRLLHQLLEESMCSPFDVNIRMCVLNVDRQQIGVSGTIKPYGFFVCLASRHSGVSHHSMHSSSWGEHAKLLESVQVVSTALPDPDECPDVHDTANNSTTSRTTEPSSCVIV